MRSEIREPGLQAEVGFRCLWLSFGTLGDIARFMKTTTLISIASLAILSSGMTIASAEDIPSGLSAHISVATNRVSTLAGLEFTVFLTNSGPTNVTIYPFAFAHLEQTIAVFSPSGRFLVQKPKPISTEDAIQRVLKPGETFTFTNKLSDEFAPSIDGISGKYHARFGGHIPSNEVEITVE
jgi:hypothetical protein